MDLRNKWMYFLLNYYENIFVSWEMLRTFEDQPLSKGILELSYLFLSRTVFQKHRYCRAFSHIQGSLDLIRFKQVSLHQSANKVLSANKGCCYCHCYYTLGNIFLFLLNHFFIPSFHFFERNLFPCQDNIFAKLLNWALSRRNDCLRNSHRGGKRKWWIQT